MEASGFLTKMEMEDERCCATSSYIEKASPATRSLYVYSFNEKAFSEAEASKEWRKYGATDKPCGEGVRMLTQNCC